MRQEQILFGRPAIWYGRNFGGGFTAEQLARMLLIKLLECPHDAPEAVRMQFNVYAEKMLVELLIPSMEDAMLNERQRIGKIIDENWPHLAGEIKNKCFSIFLNEADIEAETITLNAQALKRQRKDKPE